jgi:hypothetical protein
MKSLKAAAFVIGGFLPLAATAVPANAATVTYDWTLTGPSPSLGGLPSPGSGTITLTTGTGSDPIDAITGTIGGDMITGLAPVDTSFTDNDNLLFPIGTTFTGPPSVASGTSYVSSSNIDPKGIDVTTTAGNFLIFGSFAPNSTDVTSGNNYSEDGPTGFGVGTFALTATPRPAALPLFVGGLGVMGLFGWRRKQKAAAIPA